MGLGRGGEGGGEDRTVEANGNRDRKNFYISEATHLRVKILAVRRGKTITEILEEILGPELDRAEAEEAGGKSGA